MRFGNLTEERKRDVLVRLYEIMFDHTREAEATEDQETCNREFAKRQAMLDAIQIVKIVIYRHASNAAVHEFVDGYATTGLGITLGLTDHRQYRGFVPRDANEREAYNEALTQVRRVLQEFGVDGEYR